MNKAYTKFSCGDEKLMSVYEKAEKAALNNIKDFAGRNVLIEGGGYTSIWLETQPMGGEMYAKRNLEVALNNQLFFMDCQREDGRIPGQISCEDGKLDPIFTHYQGNCFPRHALNMYYLAEQKKDYLEYLYSTLEKFDKHLWDTRDSDGDGCLEVWCMWDLGEDGSERLKGFHGGWDKEYPPEDTPAPFESMDFMGYSHENRRVLAEISDILGNGKGDFWRTEAKKVKDKMRSYLWREDRGAFFDRDKNNEFLDTLYQGNIKAMYYGCFERNMADRFIDEHLLNPDEFWTPMPLPSIAVNDPCFKNEKVNNWSGQSQSLTYQRSILALEQYGRYSLIPILADKYINAVAKSGKFTQQFDPFTAESNVGWGIGDYGPSILTVLEFTSRLYGVSRCGNTIYWGAHDGGFDSEYTYGTCGREYTVKISGGAAHLFVDGKEKITVSTGTRLFTDMNGDSITVVNTEDKTREITVNGRSVTAKTDAEIKIR